MPDTSSPPQERGTAASSRSRFLLAAYLLMANCVMLFVLLELGARSLVSLRRWLAGVGGGAYGEELHPYLQNTQYPAPDVDAGPDFAGWVIDPPEPLDPRTACRVLYLGGSTMAYDLPKFVKQELEERGVATQAYNLAASWHTSLHSLYKLWTYSDAIQPDLVIVLHNANDFYRGFTPPHLALPEYRPDYSHHAGGLNGFWKRTRSLVDGRPVFRARPWDETGSSLGDAFSELVHSSTLLVRSRRLLGSLLRPEPQVVSMEPEVYLRSLPAFRRNMLNLRTSCEAKQLPVAFLTMPHSLETGTRFLLGETRFFTNDGRHHLSEADFEAGMERFNDVIRSLGSESRSWVLDLGAQVAEPELFADEVHLSLEGQRIEAELIADFIMTKRLLGRCTDTAGEHE